jgi:hypothetical protein
MKAIKEFSPLGNVKLSICYPCVHIVLKHFFKKFLGPARKLGLGYVSMCDIAFQFGTALPDVIILNQKYQFG